MGVNSWPETASPLDRGRVRDVWGDLRTTLARETPFARTGADTLDASFERIPDDLSEVPAFKEWSGAHLPLRWAMLRVLTAAAGDQEPLELPGPVTLDKGEMRVWPGDVTVHGNLVLRRKARVVVLGTLTVTGALIAPAYGYSLVGARRIVCRDGVSAGEILATESVHCSGTFLLNQDTHTAMSPAFTGGTLIDCRWPAQFTHVEATHRVNGGEAAAREALAIPGGDPGDVFATRLLRG
ncbi:hypothetical protein [Catenuloplanes atrovinosus]|uniref:Uncharacterized protein n=1 Tax=Catenuloplanes atrovinosus TaxID=137266 RepID=A0AAE4C809_9ACTN|nr:hypothetical protein [Catenuloplanes atrovinosus]MDR7275021.1 hypothetical protein [Catenuloplanes atrovinosus]